MDLPRHGALLGFFPDDFGRKLLEVAQHWCRELKDLDLALELRSESLERNRVLYVEVSERVDLDGGSGMVQYPSEIGWKRLVRLLVEGEFVRGAGLVPTRIVVIARGLVQTELHVVMRADVLGGIDDPALEGGVDVARRQCDDGCAGPGDDLTAEAWDTHLQPLVISDRGNFLPVPSPHLRGGESARAWHEVEGSVGLLPELEPVALVKPGRHALWVHAERHRREPLERRLLRVPKDRPGAEHLDLALRGCVEAVERRHDLAGRKHLDPEPSAAHLFASPREPEGRAVLDVERRGEGRRHPPLHFRLRDDVGSLDNRRRRDRCHRAGRLSEKSSSSDHAVPATSWW